MNLLPSTMLAALLMLGPLVTGAVAAETVTLTAHPDLAEGVERFPTPDGDTHTLDTVRHTLQRLDERAVSDRRACEKDAQHPTLAGDFEWSRSISVTMKGPRLLSYFVTDTSSCGGPHPNSDTYPVVFDLHTGAPVDWAAILPRSLEARNAPVGALGELSQGGGVHSNRLMTLLRGKEAVGEAIDSECAATYEPDDYGVFSLWPDAGTHRLLTVRDDLPHADQACGRNRGFTVPVMRKLGFAAWFVDAMAQAAPVKDAQPADLPIDRGQDRAKAQKRCGWLYNVTPGNFSLRDREGEWSVAEQGGYEALGFDDMPDMSTGGTVQTNGPHGYSCACLVVAINKSNQRVTRLFSATPLPLQRCRQDGTLPRP